MTSVLGQFTIPVVAKTVPKWFADMRVREWITPAGTNTIDSVVRPPPPPFAHGYTTDDITGAGNGAGMDQILRRMVIAYTGGHSGWWGGDGYELLTHEDAAPRWRKLIQLISSHVQDIATLTAPQDAGNPSLDFDMYEEHGMLQALDQGFGFAADQGNGGWLGPDNVHYDRFNWPTTLMDGCSTGQRTDHWKPWTKPDVDTIMDRPRPGHTCWSIHYADGKLWYPITQASNNGSGRGSRVPHSVDVALCRAYADANGAPYPQQFGNKIPCKYYPVIASPLSVSTFGISAMDYLTGRIWFQSANQAVLFYFDTKAPNTGNRRIFTLPFSPQNRFAGCGNAICPDAGRRMWVAVPSPQSTLLPDEIVVYDLDALDAGTVTVTKINLTGFGALPWARLRTLDEARKGFGMIWHKPSLSFLMWNADESPRDTVANTSTLFKLTPPLDASGNWLKASVGWTYSAVTVPGIPSIQSTAPAGITGSSYSRFNQIFDMGNGESCLISQALVTAPPSFMRLPGAL